MKRVTLLLAALVAGLMILAVAVLNIRSSQDWLLQRASNAVLSNAAAPAPRFEGLRVFMCGTSSPLPSPDRAQACVAILTPEHFLIVDAGAGSARNLSLHGLPMARLEQILVTHYHSDHIAAIPDMNLTSWVAGRPAPLIVTGGEGASVVVEGLNTAYSLDHGYRTAHHGEDFLVPELGRLVANEIEAGVVFEADGLRVTAFTASHPPIEPALSYRFDYKGRSVVVTGDTNVTEELTTQTRGVDLLLTDVLSLPTITSLQAAATANGLARNAHILGDILDYHAHASVVAELAASNNIAMVGLYHLVPAPRNLLLEKIMMRDMPGNVVLTNDGQWFELPAQQTGISVN